jgi:hypothetical protein
MELTKSRITILENITEKSANNVLVESTTVSNQPKEVRLLSQKLLIEKFNKKYSELNENQKVLLREYIGNISNTNNLKSMIQSEDVEIKKIFNKNMYKVKDKSLKIKLSEIINLLDEYQNVKKIEENHISALLRYYSLIEDLSWSK